MEVLNQPDYIMKWMLERVNLLSHVGCANNRVTIGGLVRIESKLNDRCEVSHFFFFIGQLPWKFVVALYKTYVRMYISWIIKYLCTLFK